MAQSSEAGGAGSATHAVTIKAPARQIAENSSVDGGVVVDRMRRGEGNYGFDAARGREC